MGHDKHEAEKRSKPRTDGQVSALAAWKQRKGGQRDGKADWGTASGEVLREFITEFTSRGGAVLLGYSRDRGAYRIILMEDDEKLTEWVPCDTDLDEALWQLTTSFREANYSEG